MTGTIGILGILIKNGELSLIEGDRLLLEMVAAGYRSPVTTLEEVLSQ